MLSTGMKFFTDTPITVAGLVLFVMAFALVIAQVYFRKNSKKYYQNLAEMPLKSESEL
jgi:cbb3-type cytochrome oxidase subunit 3